MEEPFESIDEWVTKNLKSVDIREPPVDSLVLARHLGLEIIESDAPTRSRSRRVTIDPEWPLERQQSTVALAIARIMREEQGQEIAVPLTTLVERLLVPQIWWPRDARSSDYDPMVLKARYITATYAMLAHRLPELVEGSIVTIVDGDRVEWRRGHGVRTPRMLAPAEQACIDQVRDTECHAYVVHPGWTVNAWPTTGSGIIVRSIVEPMEPDEA